MNQENSDIKTIEEFMLECNFEEALKLLKNCLDTHKSSDFDKLDYLILKSRVLVKMGNHKEAITLVKQLLNESKKNQIQKFTKIDIIVVMANALWRLGQLDEAMNYIQEGKELLRSINGSEPKEFAERESKLFFHEGIINWFKGKSVTALECSLHSLTKAKESNNELLISSALNSIAEAHLQKGDLHRALSYYQQSLVIIKKLGDMDGLANSMLNIAEVHRRQGKMNKAFEMLQQSLKIRENLGIKDRLAQNYNNFAKFYKDKGELNYSLEYHLKSLTIREDLGDNVGITESFLNIGSVNLEMGNYLQATNYYKRGLLLTGKTGVEIDTALAIFGLIVIFTENNQLEQANNHLKQLQIVNKSQKRRIIDQQFRLSRGLILATHNNLTSKVQALQLFQDVSDEKVIDYNLTVFAIIKLSELLLFEFQLLGSEETLIKIKTYSNKLLEIAKTQNSFMLITESYLLQSKLALIEQDIEKAELLLTQASTLAIEKGLGRLSLEITKELSLFLRQRERLIEEAKNRTESVLKIQISQLDMFLTKMVRKKTSQIEHQKEELSDFIHHMAHDLRNCLSNISGYAEIIKIHGPRQKYLDIIIKNSKKMHEMVKHCVELACAGLIINTVDEVDFNQLVDDVAQDVIPNDVQFLRDDLPKVICDPIKISQVFKNIFENAIIHGETTKVIGITRIDSDEGINIFISNDGLPIPLEFHNKIFRRGFTTKKGNTGLGMAIVKKLIEAHDWRISIEPNLLKTTFQIFIPIKLTSIHKDIKFQMEIINP